MIICLSPRVLVITAFPHFGCLQVRINSVAFRVWFGNFKSPLFPRCYLIRNWAFDDVYWHQTSQFMCCAQKFLLFIRFPLLLLACSLICDAGWHNATHCSSGLTRALDLGIYNKIFPWSLFLMLSNSAVEHLCNNKLNLWLYLSSLIKARSDWKCWDGLWRKFERWIEAKKSFRHLRISWTSWADKIVQSCAFYDAGKIPIRWVKTLRNVIKAAKFKIAIVRLKNFNQFDGEQKSRWVIYWDDAAQIWVVCARIDHEARFPLSVELATLERARFSLQNV